MGQTASMANKGWVSLLVRVMSGWALAGGLVILALVLMATYSSFASFLFAKPFPGDFELMEMGMAIAVFAFLPYCQLNFAHVSADVFTAGASARTIQWLSRMGSALGLVFASLLFWRMYQGLGDYQTYLETTAILEIPIWYAFVPILASLALWIVASVATLIYPEGLTDNPLIDKQGH